MITLFAPAMLAVAQEPQSTPPEEAEQSPAVQLNGEVFSVEWSDGDSFRFIEGPHEGLGVRLGGYNALESYGPVHRWGEWTYEQMAQVADAATRFARQTQWTCQTAGETDYYGRLLVSCDDLTEAILSSGLGHLYVFEGNAPEAWIRAQSTAQENALGMWSKGIPQWIVTSLHSHSEGRNTTYDRKINGATGESEQVIHTETYETCQEVCHEDSCMIYVPYENRYGESRAPCLSVDD